MAINKRVKSFSPYLYNAQYRGVGKLPNSRNNVFINSIATPEEHYVITKRPANFNVFVENSFIYSYDDNGNYDFVKGESRFKILPIHDVIKPEYSSEEYINNDNTNVSLLERRYRICGYR